MTNSEAIPALAALAQETRLEAFRLLVRSGRPGMPAGAIAEALGIPGPTLSFHLKELRSAGVIDCRRESRSLIYFPDFDKMQELLSFLTENCCQGTRDCATARDTDPASA